MSSIVFGAIRRDWTLPRASVKLFNFSSIKEESESRWTIERRTSVPRAMVNAAKTTESIKVQIVVFEERHESGIKSATKIAKSFSARDRVPKRVREN